MNNLQGSNIQYLVTIRVDLIQIRTNSSGQTEYGGYLTNTPAYCLICTL
jgi:hypothetical protein